MRERWSGWVWVEGSWVKVCEALSRNRCASELARRARRAGIRDRSRLALSGGKAPDWAPQLGPDSENGTAATG